jgi:hydrogenase nickel incorporation protein HypA/HybF
VHELGIAIEIAEVACARAGDATPTRIVVAVGRHTAVLPDALRFAWDVAIADTDLAGCALEIEQVDGEALVIRTLEVT